MAGGHVTHDLGVVHSIIARGLDDKELPGAHGKLDTASRAVFFSFRDDVEVSSLSFPRPPLR